MKGNERRWKLPPLPRKEGLFRCFSRINPSKVEKEKSSDTDVRRLKRVRDKLAY